MGLSVLQEGWNKTCKTCEWFPEWKNYAFCINANHSGRLECMSYWFACDKYKEGNYIPVFG